MARIRSAISRYARTGSLERLAWKEEGRPAGKASAAPVRILDLILRRTGKQIEVFSKDEIIRLKMQKYLCSW